MTSSLNGLHDLRWIAGQDHAPCGPDARLVQDIEQLAGVRLGFPVGVVRQVSERGQVVRIVPEERQRNLLKRDQVEDRTKNDAAPLIRRWLEEDAHAGRAGDLLTVEQPV